MNLRGYQQQLVGSALAAFAAGEGATLIVAATGTGKTICFAHIASEFVRRGRVMVLVHRKELLDQAVRKLTAVAGIMPDVEKAERFSDEDGMHGKPPIVVASVQTLNSGGDDLRRMHRFDPSEFSLVICDEVHHGIADSWLRVIRYFQGGNPDLKLLGVTATPDRADGRGLAELIGHVAGVYDLPDAIRDGYLVPIRQRRVRIDGLEFSKIHTVAGDFDQGELEAAMLAERPLHGVVHASIEQACGLEIGFLETIRDQENRANLLRRRMGDKPPLKSLIFTVSVAHAERMAEILNRWIPGCAESVSGATPEDEREAILRRFARGETSFLANCAVALEGFDEPSIAMVIMARPTKSRTIYAQAVGRGTRPSDSVAHELGLHNEPEVRRKTIADSDKPRLVVLDFTGNCGRHKLVCAADLLGTAKPLDQIERAKELIDEGETDVEEAIEQAGREAELERQAREICEEIESDGNDASDERRVCAEAMRRLNVVATAQYSIRQVSAFDHSDIEAPSASEDQATPKQVDALVALGVPAQTAAGYSRRQAGVVIGKLRETRCSTRQAWALRRRGFSEDEIQKMNFPMASEALDAKGAA